MGAIITFTVLLGTLFYGHCVELTQPGSMVLTPGQSLSISCKVSGYSLTDSSYCTCWLRQPAGKVLEWVGEVCGSGSTAYKGSPKNRFTVSRDTSSSTVTLQGSSLQTGDTAVYYCARLHGDRNVDCLGEGTEVTVTTVMPKSPTVSLLLVPSGASPPDALICVIRDFYPKSLRVTWSVNGNNLTGSASTWQSEKQASGLFSASSIVNVDRTIWDRNEEYTCEVLHQQKPIEQKTSRVQSSDTSCLEVTLYPPKVKELFESNLVVLDCVITGEERAAVEGASVTWTPSGTSKESQITQDGHLFRKNSTLTLEQGSSFTKQNVQCSVQQEESNKPTIKKSFSNSTSKVPEVVLITPLKQDSEFVTLVCVVTAFSPWDVFVMWRVDDGSYEEGITSEPVESKHGTFSVTSLFKVSTADWNSPSKVTCNVKHVSMPNGAAPITKSVSRATGNSNECD